MGVEKHRRCALTSVRFGIISVSTTRSVLEDESGQWIVEQAKQLGHKVLFHEVVSDNEHEIRLKVLYAISEKGLNAILLTGGTGVTTKDVTIEAIIPLFSKSMPGFASVFAQLSYQEIGSAAIISRASAGVIGRTVVFSMPGSKKACELACNVLIFPEIGHIVSHII